MAKVIQDPSGVNRQQLLPGDKPSVRRRIKTGTVAITPTPISPVKSDRGAVVAAALEATAATTLSFLNQQANRDLKQEQIELQQQQELETAKARSELLFIVDDTVNQSQAIADSPFDFNADAARDSLRQGVLSFIAGDKGHLVSNDTLRLVLDEGDARIEALIPKTMVRLDGGKALIVQEFEGRVEVDNIVFDEDQSTLNDLGVLATLFPAIAQDLVNQNLPEAQMQRESEKLIGLVADMRRLEIQQEVDAALDPVIVKPDAVRESVARVSAFTLFGKHSNIAMSKLIQENFDASKPGAMNNAADEYEANMRDIILTDIGYVKITDQTGVDVVNKFQSQFDKSIKAEANWLRSLDVLNIKQQNAQAAIAGATSALAVVQREDALFKGQLAPSTRHMIQNGTNLAAMPLYANFVADAARGDVVSAQLVSAGAISVRRFKDMGVRISKIPDDDADTTRTLVQDVIKDFFIDTKGWAKRDYIDSLDIVGFVTTMQNMREAGTFERLEPENFSLLEEIYEQAKAIPAHTALFEKIERLDDVSEDLLKAHQDNIKARILRRGQ